MVEGEDDASSGPKRKGRHFWGGLDQLRGWPQAGLAEVPS